jgi:uncharacterized protein YgiM (DUF1202 family)
MMELPMLRLTLLLIVGMGFALGTLGHDAGQLRPGLAKAEAEGRLDEVWAEARARQAAVTADPVAEPVLAEVTPKPAPVVPKEPEITIAEPIQPDTIVEPVREVVQAVEEPIFTLSAFGNEPVPGLDGIEAVAEATPEPIAELSAAGDGTIWYVTADSVNVRATPSTDAEILGKLALGEATLLVQQVDAEWARIVIQGDGVEGFVATRFLAPVAP